jgi:hypothetical protein
MFLPVVMLTSAGFFTSSSWFSLLLRGRSGDGVSAGIALVAFVPFLALRTLRARRPRVTLRTFETTCESQRCDERRYQGQEPHTSSSLIGISIRSNYRALKSLRPRQRGIDLQTHCYALVIGGDLRRTDNVCQH